MGFFTLIALFVVMHVRPHVLREPDGIHNWRVDATLYFAKMMIGLTSLPFLVFKLPLITDALTHTRKTGYDRSGACVAMLPAGERKRRFKEAFMEACKAQAERKEEGGKDTRTCTEKTTECWNGCLGPAFNKKQTYTMLDKKYGKKVSHHFKPKGLVDRGAKDAGVLEKVVVEGGKKVVEKAAEETKKTADTATNGVNGAKAGKALL